MDPCTDGEPALSCSALALTSQYSNYLANWSISEPLFWNVLHGIYIELFNSNKKTEVEKELVFF